MKAGEFIKYTRLEIYKGISNSKLKTILVFFIVIPVIAVFAGSIITRIFISKEKPINITQEGDKSAIVASTNTTIDYKIFSLQAGAFMSKNNADTLKNAIKGDDMDPVVIEDNNTYRVVISLSENKELITQKKDKLQTLGYNCLINEFTFANIEEAENEEIEKTNKLLKTCVEIIKLQVKLNDSSPQINTNNLETLKKYFMDLNDNYIELEKLNSSIAFKTFKSSFEQLTGDFIKGYEAKDLNLCKMNTGQQVFLLKDFYKEVFQIIIK